MIIFDISTLAYNTLHQLKDEELSEQLLRHGMMLKIGYILQDLKSKGYIDKNIVIACDSRGNWRKEIFPQYKMSRRISRDRSDIDWNLFYNSLNVIFDEMENELPFKVIKIERAEADDIIAVLSKVDERTIIVSSDKDFRQLCSDKIKLYNPNTNEFINEEYSLFEHILRGDKEDGIPNILSPLDVFEKGERQTTLTKKMKESFHEYEFNLSNCPLYTDEINERIEMNRKLIDLKFIPKDIKDEIINTYNDKKINKMKKYFRYLVKHRLTKIMELGVFNGL